MESGRDMESGRTGHGASDDDEGDGIVESLREGTVVAGELLGSVLSSLTDGIVVVNREGIVHWFNSAVKQRLGAKVSAAGPMTCCELLGCATMAGSQTEACLSRLALADRGQVHRRRTQLGWGRWDAWVCAHAIQAGGSPMVVCELRFDVVAVARTGDGPSPRLSVAALGPLFVGVGGQARNGDWLQQRPGQILRYLLAYRNRPAHSEAMAAALWPDRGESGISNVRYCIYKLREQLDGPHRAAPSLILHRSSGYQLDPDRLQLDVDDFQTRVAGGLAAHQRGEDDRAEVELSTALALYRGGFLAEEPYAEWAFNEREHLQSLAGKALLAISEIALEEGRLETAGAYLQRLAQLEPFDSAVYRRLIDVCLRRGRRTEALRHYDALRARLHRAFGERPDFELTSVALGVVPARHLPAGVQRRKVEPGERRSGGPGAARR